MSAPSPTFGGCNLFVANLPPGTNDERLHCLFAPFGRIVSAKVMVDLKTKILRNHGFVRFALPEEASTAIAAMHKRKVDENAPAIHVTLSTHRDDDRANECEVVYVRNLPDGVSAEQLRSVFSQYGTIADVLVPANSTGHHAVGFVKYATVDDARNAVQRGHNSTPFGGTKALQVRFKESKQMSKDRGAAKTRRDGAASPNSGQTSPAYSPHDASLSMTTPAALSLALSPGAQQLQQPHPGSFMLMPVSGVQNLGGSGAPTPHGMHFTGTVSPGHQPLMPGAGSPNQSPGTQNFQPMASPPPFGMPAMTLPGGPQPQGGMSPGGGMFSLAASQPPAQVQPLAPPPVQSPGNGRPFPGSNDLFFSGYCSQDWLLEILKPWQPVLLQPGQGSLVVRLRDENLHMTAAQNLNGMFGPTGMQLTAALVRM